MRLAVISDIHGNLEAFEEVLKDIDDQEVDAGVCLGDNVGYGPEPEDVVRLIRRLGIPCVMGNHELAVLDHHYLEWFNPEAQRSILLTEQLISYETVSYIESLEASMVYHGCLCVHGCPPDSVTTYIFEPMKRELQRIFEATPEQMCFVGHTHDLEIIHYDGQGVSCRKLFEGPFQLSAKDKYIINVGSVGQPRDGNNNAKYVIWDDESQVLEVRFVPYNIGATAERILQLGFPKFNAIRLW
jgi:predicted phosphodiesterase